MTNINVQSRWRPALEGASLLAERMRKRRVLLAAEAMRPGTGPKKCEQTNLCNGPSSEAEAAAGHEALAHGVPLLAREERRPRRSGELRGEARGCLGGRLGRLLLGSLHHHRPGPPF